MLITKSNTIYNIYIPQKKDTPLHVFDVGYHKTPPLHKYGPAVRPYFLLHLIERGKGAIERGGKVTPLNAGDMFLILPEETTLYYSDEKEPLEYYWISFYGEYARALVQKTTPLLHSRYQKSGLIALKGTLEGEIQDDIGLLNVLFEVLNSIKVLPEAPTKTDVVATALRYLEENYFNAFDITQLCKHLNYSRAYFSTVFKERTGESPYHYLNKVRLSHAKAYLEKSEMSVGEIALSVGFSSIERFSALFKKYEGVSPLAYRKRLAKSI